MKEGAKPQRVVVVGAGMVGVSAALWLQESGHEVTLIDRGAPGRGTSYGNAGIFATYACIPINAPRRIVDAPSMLLDARSPLSIQWSYLPRFLPWALRFLSACRPGRVRATVRALASILERAEEGFLPLARRAGIEPLLGPAGALYVYESEESWRRDRGNRERRRAHGVAMRDLDPSEVYELEPALAHVVHRGSYLEDVFYLRNPHRGGGRARPRVRAVGWASAPGRGEVDRKWPSRTPRGGLLGRAHRRGPGGGRLRRVVHAAPRKARGRHPPRHRAGLSRRVPGGGVPAEPAGGPRRRRILHDSDGGGTSGGRHRRVRGARRPAPAGPGGSPHRGRPAAPPRPRGAGRELARVPADAARLAARDRSAALRPAHPVRVRAPAPRHDPRRNHRQAHRGAGGRRRRRRASTSLPSRRTASPDPSLG